MHRQCCFQIVVGDIEESGGRFRGHLRPRAGQIHCNGMIRQLRGERRNGQGNTGVANVLKRRRREIRRLMSHERWRRGHAPERLKHQPPAQHGIRQHLPSTPDN